MILAAAVPAVTDKDSARAFLRWAVTTVGPGFHPDTPAGDYIVGTTDNVYRYGQLFDEDAVLAFDRALDKVFEVLDEKDPTEDPYAITLDLALAANPNLLGDVEAGR